MAINTDSHDRTKSRKKEYFGVFRPIKGFLYYTAHIQWLTVNSAVCIRTTPVEAMQNSTKKAKHKVLILAKKLFEIE